MKKRNIQVVESNQRKSFNRWMTRLTVLGCLLVLFVTLFPFNFSNPANLSLRQTFETVNHSGNFIDQLANVVLFVPFSFGLTGLVRHIRPNSLQSLAIVLSSSASLSIAVEILQFFLPSRNPTLSDVVTNSFGGILGFLSFSIVGKNFKNFPDFVARNKKYLRIRALTLTFIIYFVVNTIIAVGLQANTNFSNWDETFPLVLGNEATGDRPWQGEITEVTITHQAASKTQVMDLFTGTDVLNLQLSPLVSYQLAGQNNYPDRAGNLAALSWQKPALPVPNQPDTQLNANQWLQTPTPATLLTEKLRQTPEFTLIATLATANVNQTGPARIISLSKDPLLRNFTLGQQGKDLVLRLRTPISGVGGQYPQIVIPDVLADDGSHRLVLTYKNSLLQFYWDGIQNSYSISLSPEITFFRHLLPFGEWSLRPIFSEKIVYKALYYSLVFIPLGILLGAIAALSAGRTGFYLLLSLSGILLPPVLLEGVIASERGEMIWENVLLAIGILAITASSVQICIRLILRKQADT